jgi:hypothetical protein
MEMDRKLLSRLYQLGCAMAQQLENQGLRGKDACKTPCHYNVTVKPQKKHENDLLVDEWERLQERLEELLID